MKDILICVAATGQYCLSNSTFDQRCARCDCRVMISPSGQRRLATGDLTVVCIDCIQKEEISEELSGIFTSAESKAELERELSSLIENPWLQRN
jgi:hypothetical protein